MHPGFRLTGIETHPLREQLNNEFHSRAPIPLVCPMLVSHLAFHHDGENGEQGYADRQVDEENPAPAEKGGDVAAGHRTEARIHRP